MRHMHGSYNDGVNVLALDSGKFALNIPGRRIGEYATVADAIAAAVCQLDMTAAEVSLSVGLSATEREIAIATGKRILPATFANSPTDDEFAIAGRSLMRDIGQGHSAAQKSDC